MNERMGHGGRSASQSWIRRAAAESLGGQKYFRRIVQRASAWVEVSCIRRWWQSTRKHCQLPIATVLMLFDRVVCYAPVFPTMVRPCHPPEQGKDGPMVARTYKKLTMSGGVSDPKVDTLAHVIGILLPSDTSPWSGCSIVHVFAAGLNVRCEILQQGYFVPSCSNVDCMRQAVFLHFSQPQENPLCPCLQAL
ncbi:hypothetical protein EDD37DRAFT_405519 [Exophiala viscosa]|uniref:Uncharacterized protein n=1 Tax=Exophiala viscosa TaxID=2486360 RepID=A0AAN6DY89_9EURO|nr:hypothetical protein EDD36DRAFT_166363 [Exophiala viscosa]KAI1624258.1 hypothetical protein EDD37DRAFT_405519 [Exophiala viscosa]